MTIYRKIASGTAQALAAMVVASLSPLSAQQMPPPQTPAPQTPAEDDAMTETPATKEYQRENAPKGAPPADDGYADPEDRPVEEPQTPNNLN